MSREGAAEGLANGGDRNRPLPQPASLAAAANSAAAAAGAVPLTPAANNGAAAGGASPGASTIGVPSPVVTVSAGATPGLSVGAAGEGAAEPLTGREAPNLLRALGPADPRGAGAAPAPEPRPCVDIRRELNALRITPEELARLPPRMQREYAITRLKKQIDATCGPCEDAKKRLGELLKQQGVTVPSTRYGAKEIPPATNYRIKPLRVYIYFVRHSESCANVLKKQTTFGFLTQKGYTDPELSVRGVHMAIDRAKDMPGDTGVIAGLKGTTEPGPAGLNKTPLIVCSSQLFRAQQTALYLSDGLPADDRISDKVMVLPYIQESGFGEENTAATEAQRDTWGFYTTKLPGVAPKQGEPAGSDPAAAKKKRLDYTLFNKLDRTDASKPDVDKFFSWLSSNIGEVYKAAAGSPLPPATDAVRLMVVSHTGTMTQIYKRFAPRASNATTIKHDNLDGMEVGFGINRSQAGGGIIAPKILIPKIPYARREAFYTKSGGGKRGPCQVPPISIQGYPDYNCRKGGVCSSYNGTNPISNRNPTEGNIAYYAGGVAGGEAANARGAAANARGGVAGGGAANTRAKNITKLVVDGKITTEQAIALMRDPSASGSAGGDAVAAPSGGGYGAAAVAAPSGGGAGAAAAALPLEDGGEEGNAAFYHGGARRKRRTHKGRRSTRKGRRHATQKRKQRR
jgi:broad specificity phosphatase PhoE